ncbi:MAG: HlyD family efflux transporter periplasmic adaptor subunit [Zoogloeaceae bacterium]|nr:HlyD family efflux transporter periplasmic adaptor subunit [Zoogloeaceae bacterium]
MPTIRFTLSFLATIGVLASGTAIAHGGEDHSHDDKAALALPVAGGSPQRLADGSLFVPKPVQYQLGLRTMVAKLGALAASVEFNGVVIADPNAGGRVQAAQSGRIEPGPKGLPLLGEKVSKGQVLAYLRPVASSIERGNQQAQLAELEAQLAIAEKKLGRYEQLEGAVPQKEIEAARYEALALKKRRAAVAGSVNAPEVLVAPVSGVLAAANVVNGQVVEARDVLFEVLDPARLVVEALAYDPVLADGIGEASSPMPGGALVLQFIGAGRALRDQAMPLHFRVLSQTVPVAVGQPLKVIARTTRTIEGVAVPQRALVKNGSGETIVWVKAEAERFMPRKISFKPLDAVNVAVTAGLHEGERVVTDGATLLAQVR